MKTRRSFLLPGVALLVTLMPLMLLTGCINVSGADSTWLTQRDEKRFTVEGKPEVVLATFDGSIEIESWDRPDVLVVIEKRTPGPEAAAAIEVASSQDGNRVSVEVKRSAARMLGWSWLGHGNARLVVSVPRAADIRASSGDGAILLNHVNGTIALKSGDGRIHAADSAGALSVSTGDGGIELDRVEGTVEATTGDGRVRLSGKFAGVRAHSGDGSITIQADPGSAADRDWDITSGDGSVTLQIPDGFNADLDANTGDGHVRLDGVSVATTGNMTRNSVRGRLGAGGRALRVRTGDGSITLRRNQS
jgi:hypothetical protein